MPEPPEPNIYQLKVVLLGISPIIWRRLLVRSDSTIADLHDTLQITFGWSDDHLHCFIESDDGVGEMVQEIAQLERGQLRPEELGLTLAEAKGLLEGLQRTVVEQQIAGYSKQQSSCSLCSKPRSHKGAHAIVYRTLFGKIELSSPRLFHCRYQPQPTRSFSPLESIKWYLWHGNVFKALRQIDHLETDLEGEVITGASSEKLRVTLREFQTYIENNQQWIPNYGELWGAGETISTAFVESAVDQVLSKRFVKKQQMSWSRRGAHLLLQVRTRALNEELRDKFDEWYLGLGGNSEECARAA